MGHFYCSPYQLELAIKISYIDFSELDPGEVLLLLLGGWGMTLSSESSATCVVYLFIHYISFDSETFDGLIFPTEMMTMIIYYCGHAHPSITTRLGSDDDDGTCQYIHKIRWLGITFICNSI